MIKKVLLVLCQFLVLFSLVSFETPQAILTDTLDINSYVVSYSQKTDNNQRIIVFSDNQLQYQICLYKDSGEQLEKISTMQQENPIYVPRSGYTFNEQYGVNYPFTIPQNIKIMASHDFNGDGNPEFIIEREGPSTYSVSLLTIKSNKIEGLMIPGIVYFNQISSKGSFEIVGRTVTDSAILDLTRDKCFFYYFEVSDKETIATHKNFLSPTLYRKLFINFNDKFKNTKDFNDFTNTFKFQYANGHVNDAIKWFKSNRKYFKNDDNVSSYIKSMEEFYYIN